MSYDEQHKVVTCLLKMAILELIATMTVLQGTASLDDTVQKVERALNQIKEAQAIARLEVEG